MINKFSPHSQNSGSVHFVLTYLITFAVISNLALLLLTYPKIAFLILAEDVLSPYLIWHCLLLYWLLSNKIPFQCLKSHGCFALDVENLWTSCL